MYYIYEIASERKIGVTDNIERRLKQHMAKYRISQKEFCILESHTDIYKASEREQELQRIKGYKVDKHPYWYVRQVMNKKSKTKEAIKKRVAKTDFKANASHLQRSIIAIDPDGKRTMFSGMHEAVRQLTKKTGIKFYGGVISNICNPNKPQKISKGYTFEYA